jgi:hypothetical protein
VKTSLVLLAILTATAVQAARWVVPPEVSVRGDAYTLADLVPGAPDRFGGVFYGPTPRPGFSAEVDGQWLRRQIRNEADASEIEIPATVRIFRAGRMLSRVEVEEAVTRALQSRFGANTTASIGEVGLPPMLPEGDVRLEVRLPQGQIGKNSTVWTEVWVNGNQKGRAWAKIDAMSERVSSAAGNGRQQAVVVKGDLVRVVARAGRVTVSTSGRALGAGAVGQTILVENVASKQVVQGTVRQSGLVEVATATEEVN